MNRLPANIQLKLLSLLVALLLWLFVFSEGRDEVTLALSVRFAGLPSGLVVQPEAVRSSIRLEGPRILLLRQSIKGVLVNLDLSSAAEGENLYSGYERSLELVKGVTAVSNKTAVIRLNIIRN